jgi:hypothetical protein
MAIMVELAFSINDLLQNESYDSHHLSFYKIKLDISILCDSIIRNILMNGLYLLLDPPS